MCHYIIGKMYFKFQGVLQANIFCLRSPADKKGLRKPVVEFVLVLQRQYQSHTTLAYR